MPLAAGCLGQLVCVAPEFFRGLHDGREKPMVRRGSCGHWPGRHDGGRRGKRQRDLKDSRAVRRAAQEGGDRCAWRGGAFREIEISAVLSCDAV